METDKQLFTLENADCENICSNQSHLKITEKTKFVYILKRCISIFCISMNLDHDRCTYIYSFGEIKMNQFNTILFDMYLTLHLIEVQMLMLICSQECISLVSQI